MRQHPAEAQDCALQLPLCFFNTDWPSAPSRLGKDCDWGDGQGFFSVWQGYFLISQIPARTVYGGIFFKDHHILSSSFLPSVWITAVRQDKSLSESGSHAPDCVWRGKQAEAAREDQNCLLASAHVGFLGQFRWSFTPVNLWGENPK